MFDVGDEAPNLTLPTAAGPSVSLSEFLEEGRDVLLIFLRHLG